MNASNYTNEDGVITLKKAYLATQTTGEKVFTFVTEDGANPTCTITITQTASATATPSTASFDKKAEYQEDIVVTIANSAVETVKNGDSALTADTDYTIAAGVVTLKKAYLATLSTGSATITFETADEVNPTCTITITQTANATATPSTASFDKKTELQADIAVVIANSGLEAVKNGTTALTEDTDYTVDGGTVTLKKEYLATLSVGTETITFETVDEVNPTCTITVTQTE